MRGYAVLSITAKLRIILSKIILVFLLTEVSKKC